MSHPRENFAAILQARMSSRRLPGKILQPLAGRAILEHVYLAAREVLPAEKVLVATSTDPSDNEVEAFCRAKGMKVFRGSLDNVFSRLQGALELVGADAFFRVCADSPFYDPRLMESALAAYRAKELDLVTNVFPRSFPKGRSVELARASTFLKVNAASLAKEEQEHVFPHYYAHPDRFRIENLKSGTNDSAVNLCVDTPEEKARAEIFLKEKNKPAFAFSVEELRADFGGQA